ncbi:unnamed protein product, partial [Brenthis ino]
MDVPANDEYDVIPVRDGKSYIIDHFYNDNKDSGDNKRSITNSEIDKLEMKILSKISQELQTDDSSVGSLDSNIKIFKTTVQQIFENFYNNMQDFEIYKQKFNDILEKNKGDSVGEMENFIRDMIKHIGSSDSSVLNNSKFERSNQEESPNEPIPNITVETFKNDNYLTDSTFTGSSKCNSETKKDETVNIYLLSGTPYLNIKMNDRSLFSEINIGHQYVDGIKELASAENMRKVAAKKVELENYVKQKKYHLNDRDIPLKNSCAKKNILDEEFNEEKDEGSKFFIFKICNYICRKIRKNAFG